MDQPSAADHANAIALARYSVIAPLVARNLSRQEYQDEVKRIAAGTHRFPGSDEHGVSIRTIQRWHHWYRHGRSSSDGVASCPPGLDALKPAPREDLGSSRVLASALIERAIRLRQEEPRRTTRTLISLLQSEAESRGEEVPRIEVATLAYHLRSRQMTRKKLRQEGRAYPRYEHAYRNAVWQGDWTQGLPLPDPTRPGKTRLCHLHAFIDDYSRYVVHAEFYFRQNLPCLEDCFRKAVLKGGIPQRAYWDNGAVYHAKQIRLLAARLGMHLIFATPYAPEGKGKIERFFRTLKDSFYPEASRADLKTLDELNQFFYGWLNIYHTTVHSEIQQSPRRRWEQSLEHVRLPDPSSLVDLFLWEEKRVVDKAGCVSISSNAYPVAEHLVGQQVSVRFDPFDLSSIRIYSGDLLVQTASPMQLVSQTLRKALPKRKESPAPLESSLAFRRQISSGYRREIEAIVAQSQRPGAKPNECLTRNEFAAFVSASLDRPFTVAEAAAVADFFRQCAPLKADLVMAAMQLAIEEKGLKLHLRFYLDTIRRIRFAKESRT
jgi:putative transposase